jgi:hypothetical protein
MHGTRPDEVLQSLIYVLQSLQPKEQHYDDLPSSTCQSASTYFTHHNFIQCTTFDELCNMLLYRQSSHSHFNLTVSPILKDFRSRPSVQIRWFKNGRNILHGTKIVDRNQIFVSLELIFCRLGTKY